MDQVNHQLGVNRNTRHQIERDLANKDHSINIDHTCHNLMNTSRSVVVTVFLLLVLFVSLLLTTQ